MKSISLQELSERLAANNVNQPEIGLEEKIALGTFSAIFLLQCLEAAGVFTLRMEPRSYEIRARNPSFSKY